MKRLVSIVAALGLTISIAAALAQVPTPIDPDRRSLPAVAPRPSALVDALRAGGLVLFFRHASTDFSQNDTRSTGPTDCANQRNLLDKGRGEARAIGASLRALAIPFDIVLASPTCRTTETAMLIFGRATASTEVRGGPLADSRERYADLLRLFRERRAMGANTAIVSHGNPFYAVAGPPYLAEGEAAVVRPAAGDFEVIARIRLEQWPTLEEAARR